MGARRHDARVHIASTLQWVTAALAILEQPRQILSPPVNPRSKHLTPGFILDHHDPSLFPERWVDLAVVLRCDNSVLHERLTAR